MNATMRGWIAVVAVVGGTTCFWPAPVDAAPVDAAPVDAAPVDAAPVDAAPVDAAPVDAAPIDAGHIVKEKPIDPAAQAERQRNQDIAELKRPFELPPWPIMLGGVVVLGLGIASGWRLGRHHR